MPHGNDAYEGAEVESKRLFDPEILSGQSESRFFLYGKVWAIDKLARVRSIADSHSQRRVSHSNVLSALNHLYH